jgi:metal-responsive CopG/Arc/MetJ family transcriptional regulator
VKRKTPMRQLNIRIDDRIVHNLDRYVDGIRYRSRGHLINVLLVEWLLEHRDESKKKVGEK